MVKRILYLLGIVLTIIVGTWLFSRYCCKCASKKDVPQEVLKGAPFAFQTSGSAYFTTDNFNFPRDEFNPILPVSDSLNLGIAQLKDHLSAQDDDGKFIITGYAFTDEVNTSLFPNLGYARADAVKNYLVSLGAVEDKIAVFGELKDNLISDGNTVYGPLAYAFISGDEYKDLLKKVLNDDPFTTNFKSSQSAITLTEEDKRDLAVLVDFLNNSVPEAKLEITGHTDITGTREYNLRLGRDRANSLKNMFVKEGIKATRIEVKSQGPDNPIADNTTEEGKAKNRRAEIIIK